MKVTMDNPVTVTVVSKATLNELKDGILNELFNAHLYIPNTTISIEIHEK